MFHGLSDFFSTQLFMPHGHCYLWQPGLLWTMVTSDTLIGVAYLSISLSLYALVKKIRLPFSFVFLSFGVFIAACGATHFMEVYTVWKPLYYVAASVKVITATASVVTACLLFPLAPKVVKLAETAKASEEHRRNLQETNIELEKKSRELAEQQKILAHSAKMSALGEMAGGIAHEINSPLAIITIRANLMERHLERGSLTPEMISKESKLIASTALRIGDIIKGLKAFAREGEKDDFEKIQIRTIIQDVLVLCQTKFKNNDIDLKIDPGPEGLEIECRSVQIGQVILNLLNNAFDAVSGLTEKWVTLTVTAEKDHVEISVKDSGKGIASENISKIMEPFFTTKEVGKGTGLGLSISKGIAESHAGSLTFKTESPNTNFILSLPLIQTRI